jgi:short-subunit dehydrogenase
MKTQARPIALVTGASSGIGAELARELARDGHDLILVARRVEAMQALADELKARGVASTVIAADLSKPGAAASLLRDIDGRNLVVDVLINAAGFGATGPFEESDPVQTNAMLQVNVVALTELTNLLVPAMAARGHGKIMLVASTAAFQPGPQMAIYCASKAYVLSFGEAIAYELKDRGITVTTLCPGATATQFAETANAEATPIFKASVMSARDVARIGYAALKVGRGVVVTGLRYKF